MDNYKGKDSLSRVVLHLSRQIFMLNLTERLCLLLDIDICQRRQVTWNRYNGDTSES